jgi:hypothetical protein
MSAEQKLDEALRLLDEIDTTPLGEINRKLDRITDAVVAAKHTLRSNVVQLADHDQKYRQTLDAVADEIGASA